METVKEKETLFPQDKLFWRLVKEARWLEKRHTTLSDMEKWLYLDGYKWGWIDREFYGGEE